MKVAFGKSWPANLLPAKNFEKQDGCHSRLYENHKDSQNLEIFQLASSTLHKRYMARKACLKVSWPSFKNKMVVILYVMSKGLSF